MLSQQHEGSQRIGYLVVRGVPCSVFGMIEGSPKDHTYGRRRDRSPHRQFRTVRNSFPLYSSSVYGHLLLIPAAFAARIFSMSSAVFSSWQWR